MKILILLCLMLTCYVFCKDCKDGDVKKLQKKLAMKCIKGIWVPKEGRGGSPGAPPCQDDPTLAANGTCEAGRSECLQYSEKGANMDKDCPGTCESCDGCRCQDSAQWNRFCSYWAQYCQTPGVLGDWMTANCRKTCNKCSCQCCSYQGKKHKLGAEILLPRKCAKLICKESLVAGRSPLLSGAALHEVTHPELLTMDFVVVQDGWDCCLLPGDASSEDGMKLSNGTMVEEGWTGNMKENGGIPVTCCHGTLRVALDNLDGFLYATTTTPNTTPTTTTPTTTPTTTISNRVVSHTITKCDASYTQGGYSCEEAFDGDHTSILHGWAYHGRVPAWVVFYLASPININTIIFKTAVGYANHHLNDFSIEVLIGSTFEEVTVTRVNEVGATVQGSRVTMAAQEDVRVAFDKKMSVTAVKIHAYGSDAGRGNDNSILTEVYLLNLGNVYMNWDDDVDVILNQ